jgi:hypothetical protein
MRRAVIEPGARGPIVIQRGAMGYGLPDRKLVVSPQHRILLASPIVSRLFGVPETLVPAVKLTDMPGIHEVPNATEVVYCHLYFETHQIVRAEGAWSESLLLDQTTRKHLPHGIRPPRDHVMPPARMVLDHGPDVRQLLMRQKKNAKPLCQRTRPRKVIPVAVPQAQAQAGLA